MKIKITSCSMLSYWYGQDYDEKRYYPANVEIPNTVKNFLETNEFFTVVKEAGNKYFIEEKFHKAIELFIDKKDCIECQNI